MRTFCRCTTAEQLQKTDVSGLSARTGQNVSNMRWFAVSNRRDFSFFVAEELQELMLCNSSAPQKTGISFYIGEQFESKHAPSRDWAYHFSPAFLPDAAIGAIPGIMEVFGSKSSYAEIFALCDRYKLENDPRIVLCDESLLYTFNVDGVRQPGYISSEYVSALARKHIPNFERVFESVRVLTANSVDNVWWIVKPQADTYLSRGMHIVQLPPHLLKSKEEFVYWVNVSLVPPSCFHYYRKQSCSRRKMSFQRYIHQPALVYNRKFDIRVCVLVTSIDPLRAFIMRHSYPKIASQTYSSAPEHIDELCMHIKMLLPDHPKCRVGINEYMHPFAEHGYPKSTASLSFFSDLRFPGLSVFTQQLEKQDNAQASVDALAAQRKHFATLAEHVWASRVWPGIEAALTNLLLLVRPRLLDAERKARKEAQARGNFDLPEYRRFVLLSPDVIVDQNGRPSVIEVNTNGHIVGAFVILSQNG